MKEKLALILPGFGGEPVQTPGNIPSGPNAPANIIATALGILVVLGISFAAIFVAWGGILWITSNGDKTKLDRARRTITFSIIGLIVIILSFTIVEIVGKILGVDFFNIGK